MPVAKSWLIITRRDRDRLKATFDSVADRYQQARPAYPDELYAELLSATGLRSGDRALEVGCGYGQGDLPACRAAASPSPASSPDHVLPGRHGATWPATRRVQVVQDAFEDWQPSGPERFDLVFAATAWHWIDPAVGYQLAWRLLRPGGHLAIWRTDHVFPPGGDPFFRDLQDVYDEIGEGMPPGTGYFAPGEQPDDRAAIEGSGLFSVTAIRHFDWEISYTAEAYIELLDTFSSHIDMATGSATDSTERSAAASRRGRMARSVATGARFCR